MYKFSNGFRKRWCSPTVTTHNLLVTLHIPFLCSQTQRKQISFCHTKVESGILMEQACGHHVWDPISPIHGDSWNSELGHANAKQDSLLLSCDEEIWMLSLCWTLKKTAFEFSSWYCSQVFTLCFIEQQIMMCY